MAFADTALDSGHWCSRADCVDAFGNLEAALGHDEARLNRFILAATGTAQSILRGRWPNSWPFGTPPQEVRNAVAAIAVRNVMRGVLIARGAFDAYAPLSEAGKSADEWLNLVADSKAHLDFENEIGTSAAYIAAAPSGQFGFAEQ